MYGILIDEGLLEALCITDRAILIMDIGLYTGTISWAPLQSWYRIDVLGLTRNIDRSSDELLLEGTACGFPGRFFLVLSASNGTCHAVLQGVCPCP